MTKTPRTDAVALDGAYQSTKFSSDMVFATFARELELELAAKDAECKAKVIEALEEASEHVNGRRYRSDFQHHEATHASCLLAIRALIERRKGEGK